MSIPIFLSPSLAAKLFGISERSIRRAIKNKELPTLVLRSRYQIDFKNMFIWSEQLPNRIKKRDEHGIGQFVKEWQVL